MKALRSSLAGSCVLAGLCVAGAGLQTRALQAFSSCLKFGQKEYMYTRAKRLVSTQLHCDAIKCVHEDVSR